MGIALAGAIAHWERDGRRILALYFITSALTALTVGKVGAGRNYFIEMTAAASILLGLVWAAAKPNLRLSHVANARALVACLMIVQLAVVWWRPPLGREPRGVDRAAPQLEGIVASEPGEVLSENLAVLARTGKQIWVEPFDTTQISRAGWWDQSGVLQMIREQFFALIIVFKLPLELGGTLPPIDRWTKEELQAMSENYEVWQHVGWWYVLRPRALSDD